MIAEEVHAQLARAVTLLQLQQYLIEQQQAEMLLLRADRDRALEQRGLLLEIRELVEALVKRFTGV